MRVTFWGVRGSVPWATADSIGHGCNTPCVEIRDDTTGALLILDAGSGILGVGKALRAEPRAVAILLTHYHWDHTQGLPFFDPFYQKGWTAAIWSPKLGAIDADWVRTIFAHPYYPVSYDQLPSRPAVHLIDEGERTVGGFQVRAQRLHHPGGAFAYRIAGPTGDVVYATDHEYGDAPLDAAFASFAAGAAAIILDAHFTPAELPAHHGWGHGSWRQCAEFARAHGIGRLFLFHHKPGRTDAAMAAIESSARAIFTPTHAAREGISFDV
jgi:phosphoribosyl 1,2-cyclic phosphodiesterase